MKDFEDHELLQQIAEKSKDTEKAFNLLHKKYAKLIRYKVSYYIHDKGMIEDLSQEIWMKIYNNADKYNKDGSRKGNAKAWISQIAKNLTIDAIRRKKEAFFARSDLERLNNSGQMGDEESFSLQPGGLQTDSPESLIDLEDCYKKGVEQFSSKYQDGYRLMKIIVHEGMTTKELAEYLQKKEGSARQYLSHYKKKLWLYIGPCFETMSRQGGV